MTTLKIYSFPDDCRDLQGAIDVMVEDYQTRFRLGRKEALRAAVGRLIDEQVKKFLYDNPRCTYKEALQTILEDDAALKVQYICGGDPDLIKKYAIREQKARNVSYEIDQRAKEYCRDNPDANYVEALRKILQEDKDLAQRYGRFEHD